MSESRLLRDTSIQGRLPLRGKRTLFVDQKPLFNLHSGDTLALEVQPQKTLIVINDDSIHNYLT